MDLLLSHSRSLYLRLSSALAPNELVWAEERMPEVEPELIWLHANQDLDRLLPSIQQRFAHAKLLVLSNIPQLDQGLMVTMQGARGYLNAHARAEVLQQAGQTVRMGQVWLGEALITEMVKPLAKVPGLQSDKPVAVQGDLNEREDLLVACVANGMSNQQIASELNLSEQTVKNQLSQLYRKLGVKDRLSLALYVNERRRQIN